MIPLLAVVHVRNGHGPMLRLWLPLILVWLLIAPLVILALPIAIFIALVLAINPFPLLGGLWSLLSAARGTCVDVKSPDASVLVRIV
ncbi:hypothetical protein [Phenylobacterium montanum]|uniref:Uncharacterized protein n=1 Tax=Phenylobacterium montanum TaxID=2823693 RepID=A0A975FW76_9CAUL|nr:hypothetical protein [Caulobacter sp. S6]QUD85992.1 hypothetical protein KCG34_12830 [Caulobacter sp. S6]